MVCLRGFLKELLTQAIVAALQRQQHKRLGQIISINIIEEALQSGLPEPLRIVPATHRWKPGSFMPLALRGLLLRIQDVEGFGLSS